MHVMGCHDFAGRVYPVSRSHDEIMGLKAYPSIDAVPEPVDLAVLIIPAAHVPGTLEQCAEAGARSALILSSGFAEDNTEGGEDLTQRIRDIAARTGMLISGPNAEGYANMAAKLCPTFSPAVEGENMQLMPPWRTGGLVAAVAQSGGMGFAFYDRGRPKEVPFSHVVTTGNEACLESLDVVEHLIDTGEADVFVMFMEDVKTPEKLARVAGKALRAGKPMIVTKIGRSAAGTRAAASHTASLAGAYETYRAIFRRYGVIEGNDIEEMVDIAAGFSYFGDRLPAGNRVGIFTASGGGGAWMADSCVAAGLEVPMLDPATRANIDQYLPSYGTSQNPVDGTAGVVRQVGYARISEMIAASDAVDAVITIASTRLPDTLRKEQEKLTELARATDKPVMFWSYTLPHRDSVRVLAQSGLPLFTNMRNCTRALAAMADYRRVRDRWLARQDIRTDANPPRRDLLDDLAAAPGVIIEHDAMRFLARGGIEAVGGRLVHGAEAAVEAAAFAGAPVALKIQSPDLPHKAAAGGVALNLSGDDAVRRGFEEIQARVAGTHPDARIIGTLVQPMVRPGLEMILGISNEGGFGPMLMVGFGGVAVETSRDVAFSPAPLDGMDARDLLRQLRGAGFLNETAHDIDALVDLMVRLSRFAAGIADHVTEIDLNPVLVHRPGEGVSIIDALMIKHPED
jgi:acyl-CoA synthetase (NDP forming)